MKKHNLLITLLAMILMLSCERDQETINSDVTNTSSNEALSSTSTNDRSRKREKIYLPESNFDFEAHTVMVDVGGDKFPVVDAGEGPVALLIHGWPDSKEMWRYQIPFLVNAGYRVVVPDLRGFGGAPKTEDPAAYSIAALMGDVITLSLIHI